MSSTAIAFDEDVLRLGNDPALSADAIRWPFSPKATAMSSSLSDACSLRQSAGLFELVQANTSKERQIDAQTVAQALALLDALPPWVPSPELAIESDGQIGFDWHCSRDRVLSLNVGPSGMIGYAALIGLESTYGRLPFAGVLPQRVRDLLQMVLQAATAS